MTNTDVTAVALQRALQTCPACSAGLDGHSYARFAGAVASDANSQRLSDFCRALKARDWATLTLFDEFDPLLNALEAIVLRCTSGTLVMLAVRNPFELYESNVVLDYDLLDTNAGNELGALVADDDWRPLWSSVAA